MQERTENKKELLDPNQPDIKISNKKENKVYLFLSKIILKKYGFVELVSLGNTCEKSIKISEKLVREGFAKIVSLESDEVITDNENKNRRPACKFYIKLEKTENFDKLVEGFLK